MVQHARWQQLEALFHDAVELDPHERAAFLDERCDGDPELRSEVESLLHSSDRTSGFLNKPILDVVKEIANGPPPTIVPGAQLGRYRIISKLGAGGMGQVYVAEDSRLKRRVALKVLAPDLTRDQRALRRFEHEAQAASALNHPNILTIFEFGEINGLHFIASELVEGQTLRQKLRTGRLDVREAVDIASQTAWALEAAHARGIAHRDIKPENIVVRPDGLVKVLDFGIAKLTETPATDTAHRGPTTHAGMVLGTLNYMSPEQARGIAVDGRSDIFTLGAVLYEMISGRAPFEGKTGSDLIAEILKTDPPPLAIPEGPSQLQTIVSRAICKDREARYQRAAEFADDLLLFKREMELQAHLQKSAGQDETQRTSGEPSLSNGTKFSLGRATLATSSFLSSRIKWSALLMLVLAVAFGYFLLRRAATSRGVGQPHSLAILPFQNLRPDPATDFLGFSLADAVITKLGYVSALTLRPSSAVDKYRNRTIDPQRVAAELKVDTLLTGSFVKDGDDLRITTQLIDAMADKILWQDTIDLKYDKLLTVQDRVSQQIIKGLELNLSPTEAEHLKPDGRIGALAYEYYLRGVDLYSLNDFSAAVKMLEKSAEMQPDYAPIWAHLGRAYATSASLHFGGRALYQQAQAAYERALTLNPSLVEPRIYMGNLLTDTGRVEQAVPLLRAALQAHPNNAEAHWELGYAYRFGGMLSESIAEAEQARGFDPEVKINSSALNSYLYLGQYDKFQQSLPANNYSYILFYRGFAEYHERRWREAAEHFNSAYDLDPTLLPAQVGKALSYSIAHQNARGLEFLHETETRLEKSGVGDAELIYKVAEAYAMLGDKQSALRMLQRSIEGGFFCYPYFNRDPLLDSLRDQPVFQQRMQEARLRHEEFKAKFF
jgi:serine/threonine protein kinase